MKQKVNKKCQPNVCPFNPYTNQAYGMSPDGWAYAQQEHEENHIEKEVVE